MSTRFNTTPPACAVSTCTSDTFVDRLTRVLEVGVKHLALVTNQATDIAAPKRKHDETKLSPIEALGLFLRHDTQPTVKIDGKFVALERNMNVDLYRGNHGLDRGVYFDDFATVLIISPQIDKYRDYGYEAYKHAVQKKVQTKLLPVIKYALPISSNRYTPSSYVTEARTHLLGLIEEAALESRGDQKFSNDYEQPLSKIYVFEKNVFSGNPKDRTGSYKFLGRFKALGVLQGEPISRYFDYNKLTHIDLKAFDPPQIGPRKSN